MLFRSRQAEIAGFGALRIGMTGDFHRHAVAALQAGRNRVHQCRGGDIDFGRAGRKGNLAPGSGWRSFAAANYLDLLEANAFGNYRTLMQKISTNTAMGMFLTFRGSMKANPTTGSLPDENYSRELMQLFTDRKSVV